jgi:hypothetical protein
MRRAKSVLATLLISTTIASSAAADCPNAVDLKVGDTVKDCDRVGLSLDYNKTVQKQLVDGDYNAQIVDEQGKQLTLKDLDIQYQQKRGDNAIADSSLYQSQLAQEKQKSKFDLWIGIGIGLLAAYIGAEAVRAGSGH